MTSPRGGQDRISTKSRLSEELRILGEVLVEARERGGLKQAEVAARLGVPPSYLSKVENGTRRLDAIELVRLSLAMGEDPAVIVHELHRKLEDRRKVSVSTQVAL
jgi:transcriptional regulator with XRE-family HTH domain